jgi:DNA invertase Pin-like site-specific DNA recombinase
MTETDASDAKVALNDAALRRPAPPIGILIGYARCSTEKQDLTAQREILRGLGVADERVYLDHGLTGTNRSRPGLDNALAALREGDTLVVPKLDRLARSVPDARAIGDSLAAQGVRLSLGGSVYDPSDPMGKCFFNILATFAEFEVDLLRMRTREGMAIARANRELARTPAKNLAPTIAERSDVRRREPQPICFSVVDRGGWHPRCRRPASVRVGRPLCPEPGQEVGWGAGEPA